MCIGKDHMLRAGMHAEGSHVCMVPMEEGRCRSKGEMDHIGPVGRKGIVADGSRIGLADFVSKLSCQI